MLGRASISEVPSVGDSQLFRVWPARILEADGSVRFGMHELGQAVRTVVVNKRAGGMGLISVRKAFQKPMLDGVILLNAIQDVCLAKDVSVA
jgi:DhnA family fructose-bisphosphate aldolase class Ia